MVVVVDEGLIEGNNTNNRVRRLLELMCTLTRTLLYQAHPVFGIISKTKVSQKLRSRIVTNSSSSGNTFTTRTATDGPVCPCTPTAVHWNLKNSLLL